MKFILTAFADEVSPELGAQVEALTQHGVKGLDVRSLNGVNVLDLSLADLEAICEACRTHNLHVSCVGSPVNKVPYDLMGQARELDRLRKACYAAGRLHTKKIRLFTPEVPAGQHEEMSSAVIGWMKEQKRVVVDHGLTVLHENDAKFWGAYPENAKRLFGELGDEHFRAAFDFANSVIEGITPFDSWFPWIVPYLDTLHMKDAIGAEHKVVPVGEGDGQIVQTLRYLVEQGWNGPLTIEPHLAAAGRFGGFSGPDLFEVAVNAVRKAVSEAGAEA